MLPTLLGLPNNRLWNANGPRTLSLWVCAVGPGPVGQTGSDSAQGLADVYLPFLPLLLLSSCVLLQAIQAFRSLRRQPLHHQFVQNTHLGFRETEHTEMPKNGLWLPLRRVHKRASASGPPSILVHSTKPQLLRIPARISYKVTAVPSSHPRP